MPITEKRASAEFTRSRSSLKSRQSLFWTPLFFALGILLLIPSQASAMHLAEGLLPFNWAVVGDYYRPFSCGRIGAAAPQIH